ncbi:AB hydrolase superfamily protein B1A11.02 [Cytospora mali]|uniref:AB hydrolase superfamily protein B1A11.02 n=1 Tax=Cytospora mali TaxID=578113 RepID=A0A194VVW4_CYTMA|nr:AB hydrolase superfamily protein B1A11.02 [Valsa mali]
MHDATQAGLAILGACPPHLKETTFDIPLPDGTTSRTIITRPASTSTDTKKCPLIILFHGGSWSVGGPEFMLSPARGYTTVFGAIVACPSYRLIPENPFPAPMQSSWEATAWLSHPENLKDGPLKGENVEFGRSLGIVLGGVSAGGNISAVIAGIAAESTANENSTLANGLSKIAHPIKGIFLSIPVLVHETMVPAEYAPLWTSRVDNADAAVLSAERQLASEKSLRADYHSPWFTSLNLDLDSIRGYHTPRVYFQAGSLDCLRDDSIVYEKALKDKGVSETRIGCWPLRVDYTPSATVPQ